MADTSRTKIWFEDAQVHGLRYWLGMVRTWIEGMVRLEVHGFGSIARRWLGPGASGVGRGKVVHPFARVHRKWFTRARGWRALGELLCEGRVHKILARVRGGGRKAAPG